MLVGKTQGECLRGSSENFQAVVKTGGGRLAWKGLRLPCRSDSTQPLLLNLTGLEPALLWKTSSPAVALLEAGRIFRKCSLMEGS